MTLGQIQIGQLSVSKLIIGGNPFSGFSHQSPERDLEMRRYYTTDRIKQTLRHAEKLGINTFIGRGDRHIMRVLLEYWDEGGRIQWIAQTCPELGSVESGIMNAVKGNPKACFIHGGHMDFLFAQNKLDKVIEGVSKVKAMGMPVGIAGHNPEIFEWAEKHLDVDFYMCSYYNPTPRDEQPEHIQGTPEKFLPQDRDRMVRLIQTLGRPVIHYKVLAAGRNTPEGAFAFVAKHLRPQDAVCVGVYTPDNPGMLEEDLLLLESDPQ
jgi:hypothetical protein